jgi:hypothetical protein
LPIFAIFTLQNAPFRPFFRIQTKTQKTPTTNDASVNQKRGGKTTKVV